MMVEGLSPRVRGEPTSAGYSGTSSAVYPRVCGGTAYQVTITKNRQGLSPRVRGNRVTSDSPGSPARSIPACAGNRDSPFPVSGFRRSIPACAGEPHAHPHEQPQSQVYPRVCGGTQLTRNNAGGGEGLSPRVRGNPKQAMDEAAYYRSIPACAGEPRAPCS